MPETNSARLTGRAEDLAARSGVGCAQALAGVERCQEAVYHLGAGASDRSEERCEGALTVAVASDRL